MLYLSHVMRGLSHPPIVYFLRVSNRVKIGTTTNLGKRVNSLSLALADVWLIVPGGRGVEREFHSRFAGYRVDPTREWFRLAGELSDFLKMPATVPEPREVTPEQPALEPGVLVTIEHAVTEGILTGEPESLRRVLRRDRGHGRGPVGKIGPNGLEYDPDALAAWRASRPRSGNG